MGATKKKRYQSIIELSVKHTSTTCISADPESGRRRPGHLARVSPPRQSRPISIDFVLGSVRVSQPARLIRMSSVNSEAEEESQEGKPQRGAAPGRAVGDDGKRKKDEKSVILRSRDKFSAV